MAKALEITHKLQRGGGERRRVAARTDCWGHGGVAARRAAAPDRARARAPRSMPEFGDERGRRRSDLSPTFAGGRALALGSSAASGSGRERQPDQQCRVARITPADRAACDAIVKNACISEGARCYDFAVPEPLWERQSRSSCRIFARPLHPWSFAAFELLIAVEVKWR